MLTRERNTAQEAQKAADKQLEVCTLIFVAWLLMSAHVLQQHSHRLDSYLSTASPPLTCQHGSLIDSS